MDRPGLMFAKRPQIVVPVHRSQGRLTEATLADMRALGMVAIPEISGGRGGYNQVGSIVTTTADGVDLNDIWAAYNEALRLYNAQRDPLLAALVFPVTDVVENVVQGGNTVDFEEASEFGVPRAVRPEPPTSFSLGYSFKWYDIGLRFTWLYLAENPASEIDTLNNQILEADNRKQFEQVLKQVFNNTTRVANINDQNYNVFPIYNGDGTVPPKYKLVQPATPHTHFLVSGGATVVSGDLDDMETHLKHHGYSWQEGSALILLVNSAQTATIRTFRVANGDAYDFIGSQGIPSWALTDADIVANQDRPGAAPPSTFRGLPVIGRYGPWFIVEEDLIPAGYMLGIATGGNESAQNLVGIREHTNGALRGLRLVKGQQPDYPLIDSYYNRGFGTGVRQRGAGVVMQIKAAGSYDIPAGYTW